MPSIVLGTFFQKIGAKVKNFLRLSHQVKFIYSEKATKGPGAKNAIRENPGYFYQILNFES